MKRFLVSFFFLCALAASAQTPHPPINSPVFRAFDANGAPLAGGILSTYAAGSSTPLATYSDAGDVSPNTNPVVLDSTGSAKIFLAAASYKFVLKDANGVEQWTVDNISGAPPASDVTSVFGRVGAVVAVTGDYSCGQISGAVCSIPTIYYQTVNAGGTDLPQESTLKLIDGTNITTSCLDNSGGHSTDCTIAVTGSSIPSTVCGSNGCSRTWVDGTIEQWGQTTSASGGQAQTVSASFPVAFTTTTDLQVVVSETGEPSGDGSPYPADCHISSGPTTSGFSAVIGMSVQSNSGGEGYDHFTGQYCSWHAWGH